MKGLPNDQHDDATHEPLAPPGTMVPVIGGPKGGSKFLDHYQLANRWVEAGDGIKSQP